MRKHPQEGLEARDGNQTLASCKFANGGIQTHTQTIKCLLIHPNPESALNEEAGRLLLEKYEDYCKHAALMTSVHGKKIKWEEKKEEAKEETKEGESKENDATANNLAPQPSNVKPVVAKKSTSTIASKQKKNLKRL